MFVDYEGHIPKWLAWAISGAAIVGGILLSATGIGGILDGILIGAGAGSLIEGYTNEGLGGLAFKAATDAVNLSCIGHLALSFGISFAGGFAGSMLGAICTSYYDFGLSSSKIELNDLMIKSSIAGGLNVLAGLASGVCTIVGNAGRLTLDVNSELSLRLMAGIIAGGTEAVYDFSSYLIWFLMEKIFDL